MKLRVHWLLPLLLGISDLLIWVCLYLGISKITGSYNLITLDSLFVPIGFLMFSTALIGAYRFRTDFASLRYASEHCIACLASYPVAAFLLYVVASFGTGMGSSRAIFSIALILFAPTTLFIRRLFWFASLQFRAKEKYLVLVDEDYGPFFYTDYLKRKNADALHLFAINDSMKGRHLDGPDSPLVRFGMNDFIPLLNRQGTTHNEVVIVASHFSKLDPDFLLKLGVLNFGDRNIYSLNSFYEKYWSRMCLKVLSHGWPLETNFVLVQNSAYSAVKRLVDFVIATVALIILSPLLCLVSLAVRILDGRPVIYQQSRTGIHEKPFTLYKFRTMRNGSDLGNCYTSEGDSRITPLGVFLRKTRLDELPQLWNVLRGDMSIIGPRAEWVKLVEDYERQIPHYHFRHLVRPGITGWAQVNYPYGSSLDDTLQKLSYDLFYIRNFSLRLDAEVILKTLHVMSFGKGR